MEELNKENSPLKQLPNLTDENSAILGCILYCSFNRLGFMPPAAKRAKRETPRPCSRAEGEATTGGS